MIYDGEDRISTGAGGASGGIFVSHIMFCIVFVVQDGITPGTIPSWLIPEPL